MKIIPETLTSCDIIHIALKFPDICLQVTNIFQKSMVVSAVQSQVLILQTLF